MLFSSHQLDLVEDLCEQVTIIDHGRLVVSGTVDHLATSGGRRLVVRVDGRAHGRMGARPPRGAVVRDRRRGGAARPRRRRGLRHRPAGCHGVGPGHPVLLRTTAAVRGVPRGPDMKFVYVLVLGAVIVAVRVGRRRRRGDRDLREERAGPRGRRTTISSLTSVFGEVGLVASREIRERVRGRIFRVGTVLVLLGVGAAIVIPKLHTASPTPQRIGVVGTVSPSLSRIITYTGRESQTGVRVVSRAVPRAGERGSEGGTARRRPGGRWPEDPRRSGRRSEGELDDVDVRPGIGIQLGRAPRLRGGRTHRRPGRAAGARPARFGRQSAGDTVRRARRRARRPSGSSSCSSC